MEITPLPLVGRIDGGDEVIGITAVETLLMTR
jgi:hypothetical protein